MKPISTHVPEEYLDGINDLIRRGKYSTKSEFIREAIRRLIRQEKQVQ
ncbi:MAG: ribbon-helix-helix domain-containing protein [Promethearchaeota archaeon]